MAKAGAQHLALRAALKAISLLTALMLQLTPSLCIGRLGMHSITNVFYKKRLSFATNIARK